MQTIDVKDVEQAKTARNEIMHVAAVLLSEIQNADEGDFEAVLDQAVVPYKFASGRIKLNPATTAAPASGAGS